MYWFIKIGVIHGELVDTQEPNTFNLISYDLKDKYIEIKHELVEIFEQACKKQAVNKLLGNTSCDIVTLLKKNSKYNWSYEKYIEDKKLQLSTFNVEIIEKDFIFNLYCKNTDSELIIKQVKVLKDVYRYRETLVGSTINNNLVSGCTLEYKSKDSKYTIKLSIVAQDSIIKITSVYEYTQQYGNGVRKITIEKGILSGYVTYGMDLDCFIELLYTNLPIWQGGIMSIVLHGDDKLLEVHKDKSFSVYEISMREMKEIDSKDYSYTIEEYELGVKLLKLARDDIQRVGLDAVMRDYELHHKILQLEKEE